MAKAAIKEGPPIQVAWREVEDRGVWWFVTEESDRLGKAARPDDLHVARDQVRHEPTRQIGTVNKKQPCHRSARRAMQTAYHLRLACSSHQSFWMGTGKVSGMRVTILSSR